MHFRGLRRYDAYQEIVIPCSCHSERLRICEEDMEVLEFSLTLSVGGLLRISDFVGSVDERRGVF
jgi:hypothetical protein